MCIVCVENLVKTLDDEEVQFLDYVDQVRQEDDKRKRLEEAKELSEFRNAVSELREKEFEKALKKEIGLVEPSKTSNTSKVPLVGSVIKKPSQTQLLAGLVKRKTQDNETTSTNDVKKSKQEGKFRLTPFL